MTGPVGYWHDIHGKAKALVDAGVQVVQEIKDVSGGKLIAP